MAFQRRVQRRARGRQLRVRRGRRGLRKRRRRPRTSVRRDLHRGHLVFGGRTRVAKRRPLLDRRRRGRNRAGLARACEGPNGTCDAPVMLPIVANGIAEEESPSLVTRRIRKAPRRGICARTPPRCSRFRTRFPTTTSCPVSSSRGVATARSGAWTRDTECVAQNRRARKASRGRNQRPNARVACVCAGPKNTVASGGDDGIVRLWRPRVRCSTNTHTCVVLEPAGDTVCPDVLTTDFKQRSHRQKKKKMARVSVRGARQTLRRMLRRAGGGRSGGLALYAAS